MACRWVRRSCGLLLLVGVSFQQVQEMSSGPVEGEWEVAVIELGVHDVDGHVVGLTLLHRG